MDTTKIGDNFEQRVYTLFSEELKQRRLLFLPENCKIFRKKGYFSKDREKNIIVDISIEVSLSGRDNYSMLMIIECKSYNHPVPVDDVEEFYAKIQQISGANVKGIVVSSNSFQDGAFKYSKSKGIGLIRILDDSNFKWILTRASTGLVTWEEIEKSRSTIYYGMTTEEYTNEYIDFFSFYNSKVTNSAGYFIELITQDFIASLSSVNTENLIVKQKGPAVFVPYVSRDIIDSLCGDIIKGLKCNGLEIPIEQLCANLVASNEILIKFQDNLGVDALGFEILGKISFNPVTIYISGSINNLFRRKFTLVHELGHYFLKHSQYMTSEYYSEDDFENNPHKQMSIQDIKRLEWQANSFASSLLLPKDRFLHEFHKLAKQYDLKNRGHGLFYVDNQGCNLDNFFKITNKLKENFGVSRKVTEIRLKELGVLNDKRYSGFC
ncbi:MAG: ImmA/IrrE family metallo-endopeptidase [Ignavibacteria bacterium]|jgi:Zn-dependent peptidase ImmA (M78 family)|nr:ImmA/IrrE family metallo-endopeptidase [Ignavibacteria bacterium]MCU7503780.1 ImmA/IrrE family metallo-endopeptidase [Ignavibacteria bacterium]MCU7517206.1 ImmA/IrrE family metallo-endopeptidase [Ignavibacteria bacterium]